MYRQSLVKKYVLTQRDGDSNMQGWASVNGFSSVMQPYRHIYDVEHARWMVRVCLQTGPNVGDQRCRAFSDDEVRRSPG